MTNKKESIPEEVFDYCIDNKVSIEEGLKVFIEKKLETVETGLADLKDDVTNAIDNVNMKISNKDIDDVENFLDFLNNWFVIAILKKLLLSCIGIIYIIDTFL